MSIIKPDDLYKKRRKELLDNILKDLSPGLRDQARRLLEELDIETLSKREKVLEYLRKKGIIM